MNMRMSGAALCAALLAALVLAGCTAEKYGSGVNASTPSVQVKDVYFDRSVAGRTVTLDGIISSQCGSNGCWFVLQDGTGQIFVDLSHNNMSIPPRMNKRARVTGQIVVAGKELQLVAQGVEVR